MAEIGAVPSSQLHHHVTTAVCHQSPLLPASRPPSLDQTHPVALITCHESLIRPKPHNHRKMNPQTTPIAAQPRYHWGSQAATVKTPEKVSHVPPSLSLLTRAARLPRRDAPRVSRVTPTRSARIAPAHARSPDSIPHRFSFDETAREENLVNYLHMRHNEQRYARARHDAPHF